MRVGIKTGIERSHQLIVEFARNHANRFAKARLDADPKGLSRLGAFHRRRSLRSYVKYMAAIAVYELRPNRLRRPRAEL